jgi:hypothetical protein
MPRCRVVGGFVRSLVRRSVRCRTDGQVEAVQGDVGFRSAPRGKAIVLVTLGALSDFGQHRLTICFHRTCHGEVVRANTEI